MLVFIPDFGFELLDIICAIWEILYGAGVHTTKLKMMHRQKHYVDELAVNIQYSTCDHLSTWAMPPCSQMWMWLLSPRSTSNPRPQQCAIMDTKLPMVPSEIKFIVKLWWKVWLLGTRGNRNLTPCLNSIEMLRESRGRNLLISHNFTRDGVHVYILLHCWDLYLLLLVVSN